METAATAEEAEEATRVHATSQEEEEGALEKVDG
jgi:hypothetical protein